MPDKVCVMPFGNWAFEHWVFLISLVLTIAGYVFLFWRLGRGVFLRKRWDRVIACLVALMWRSHFAVQGYMLFHFKCPIVYSIYDFIGYGIAVMTPLVIGARVTKE